MSKQSASIVLAAAAAFVVCACESTTDVSPARATTALEDQRVNPDCRPGNTPAGTVSGLHCTPGSNTGQWAGIDANVEGASTQMPAIVPARR
jgi:hypothetical protein